MEDDEGTDAITILNRGLPEVELSNGNHLAMTLLRCINWLSRSDIPERPMHAGPGEETPGAQEMNEEYVFHYGFLIHSKDEPIYSSAEHADVFQDFQETVTLDHAEPPQNLFESILQLGNPAIRISSMRMKNNSILITLYNLENKDMETEVHIASYIKKASQVKLDGTSPNTIPITNNTLMLSFKAREIKMCMLNS